MKIVIKIIAGFFLVIAGLNASAQNLWFDYGLEYKYRDRLITGLEFEHRYLNTMQNYMNATTVNVAFKISPDIKLAGSYRYSVIKEMEEWKNNFEDRQRFCIDLHSKFDLTKNFDLKNRVRYQTSLEDRDDVKRYIRDKITFEIKVDKKTDLTISDEIFVRIDKDKPVLNRLTFGLQRQIGQRFYFEPFFHIDFEQKWGYVRREYVMGTGLYYRL